MLLTSCLLYKSDVSRLVFLVIWKSSAYTGIVRDRWYMIHSFIISYTEARPSVVLKLPTFLKKFLYKLLYGEKENIFVVYRIFLLM